MAVTITVEQVKTAFPDLVIGISDMVIQCYITTVDRADMCLDGNNVPDAEQECSKLFGVAYLIEIQLDGNITNTRSANGDSISRDKSGKRGIDQFTYGRALQANDASQCVINAIGPQGSTPIFVAVGSATYKNRRPVYEQDSDILP